MAAVISVYDYYASNLNKFRQENQKLGGLLSVFVFLGKIIEVPYNHDFKTIKWFDYFTCSQRTSLQT